MMPATNDNLHGNVLSLLPPSEVEARVPLLATAADIRELIQYLKLKPNGVVAAEELDRPKRRLFEERKLAAYQLLGITTTDGITLKLSPRGWQFAKNFDCDAQAFRHLLTQTMPCWSVLHWMSEQNIDMITSTEVVNFWQKLHPATFPCDDEEQMRGAVISFFSFCQGTALGTMTLGKRGHITRFCADRAELKSYVEGKPPTALDSDCPKLCDLPTYVNPPNTGVRQGKESEFKVLIQSDDNRMFETLQMTLNLMDISSEQIAVGCELLMSPARLFAEHQLRSCALLVVIGEECLDVDNARVQLNEKVLLGLGAAHILFDQRVVVLADKRVLSPEGIADLKYYKFDGSNLHWDLGLELVRVLTQMKRTLECQFAVC